MKFIYIIFNAGNIWVSEFERDSILCFGQNKFYEIFLIEIVLFSCIFKNKNSKTD